MINLIKNSIKVKNLNLKDNISFRFDDTVKHCVFYQNTGNRKSTLTMSIRLLKSLDKSIGIDIDSDKFRIFFLKMNESGIGFKKYEYYFSYDVLDEDFTDKIIMTLKYGRDVDILHQDNFIKKYDLDIDLDRLNLLIENKIKELS